MIKIKVITEPLPSEAKQADLFKTQQLLMLLNFFFDTEKGIKNTPSPELYLEQAFVRASMCTQIQIDELLSSFSLPKAGVDMPVNVATETQEYKEFVETKAINSQTALHNKVQACVKEDDIPSSDEPVSPPIKPATDEPVTLSDTWNSIVNRVSKGSRSLGSILLHSRLIKLVDNELRISYRNDFFKEQIHQKKALIETAAKEIIGRAIYITLEPEVVSVTSAQASSEHKNLLEEPVVKSTIELFNAEPVLE
jgi:hypothetical protein